MSHDYITLLCPNKSPANSHMKNKKYQVIRTVKQSNQKIIGSVYIDTLAHIYIHFHSWIQVRQ